ncbi:hypothetical protein Ahy_A06g028592 [Arachis hypogaea]|uniref:HMA domain-containing protein n=1 Tax=Arachis hypogaea TaxID=3818 RepID=A0A445CRE8_ARAHY|nr:hypothetical protein Ahy_A06g028592 [Arachis hypogaea]
MSPRGIRVGVALLRYPATVELRREREKVHEDEREGSIAELVSVTASTAVTAAVEALLRLLLPSEPPPREVAATVFDWQGTASRASCHKSKSDSKQNPLGITSFSIDVESKRVTVMGYISPLEVFESISKVKRAKF